MLRSALAAVHGSTISVSRSVASALPPLSSIVSRRSVYSEHPASSRARPAAHASERRKVSVGCMRKLRRCYQIKRMPGVRLVGSGDDARLDRAKGARLVTGEVGLAEEKEIGRASCRER